MMSANTHKSGHGCPSCAGNKKTTKEIFIKYAKLKYGNKHDYSLISEVNNDRTKIKIKCNICGNIFEQRVNNYLNGKGCPKCTLLAKCDREAFIKKAKLKHGDKYDYSLVDNIKNRKNKVKIICKKCGMVFEQRANNHLNGQGCPKCNESHLERDVRIKLYKNNINFETQKTFPWLRNKREMPLDFYLTDYNIAIECQGIQHHKVHGFFTEEKVRYTKAMDKLKLRLCREHNVPIFYINYNDNLEERLNELLNKINLIKDKVAIS